MSHVNPCLHYCLAEELVSSKGRNPEMGGDEVAETKKKRHAEGLRVLAAGEMHSWRFFEAAHRRIRYTNGGISNDGLSISLPQISCSTSTNSFY